MFGGAGGVDGSNGSQAVVVVVVIATCVNWVDSLSFWDYLILVFKWDYLIGQKKKV